jgi:hypothetical protein
MWVETWKPGAGDEWSQRSERSVRSTTSLNQIVTYESRVAKGSRTTGYFTILFGTFIKLRPT